MIADDIPLFSEPSKRAAELAIGYPRYWYLTHIPKKYLTKDTASIEDVMKEWLTESPESILDVENITETIEEKQTLLLATNCSYADLDTFDTSLSYFEYQKLVENSRTILGGGAEAFFARYPAGTFSKRMKNQSFQNTSTKSPAPRGTGTKKQTSSVKADGPK
jgi:hypothetical protein